MSPGTWTHNSTQDKIVSIAMADTQAFCNLENIRSDVSTDHLSTHIEIKDIKYFANKINENDLEDKGLALMILRVMSGDSSKQSSYNTAQKKPRSSYDVGRPYHRWILCADLANPPNCFAIITESLSQTNRLLIHNLDDAVVGNCFYLVEPDIAAGKMGKSLHVLRSNNKELLPVKRNTTGLLVKEAIFTLPTLADQMIYYWETGQKITLKRVEAPTDPSCTGFQCDRQGKRGECLCLNLLPGSPMVYCMDVEFGVDPKKKKTVANIAAFRSLRTTRVFFKSFIDYSSTTSYDRERSLQRLRRSQIKSIVEYVNQHGGWSLVGWCRMGKIAVEGESEKMENLEVTLHLSYLYPTNQAIFELEDFSKLQIVGDGPGDDATPKSNPWRERPEESPVEGTKESPEEGLKVNHEESQKQNKRGRKKKD